MSTTIDFEPGGTYVNNGSTLPIAPVVGVNPAAYWDYFEDAYGISFNLNTKTGIRPYMASVGGNPVEGFATWQQFLPSPCTGSVDSAGVSGGNPFWADQPDQASYPNDPVGCWFLTSRPPGGGTIRPLFINYSSAVECSKASGVLMDVDFQEFFIITAYNASDQLLDSVIVESNAINVPNTGTVFVSGGDGSITRWNLDTQGPNISYLKIVSGSNGGNVGIAFDNFNFCSDVIDDAGCCDDEVDLIPDGDVEGGIPSGITFNPAYDFMAPPSGPVLPGEHVVVKASDAGVIAGHWGDALQDGDGDCDGGHVLVLNGNTGNKNSFPSMIPDAVKHEIYVEEGEYMYCFQYKNLEQCGFEVFRPEFVHSSVQGNGITATSSSCAGGVNACEWTRVSHRVVVPSAQTISLNISMTEDVPGDGNDVAFDNFSLKKLTEFTQAELHWDFQTFINGSTFNLVGRTTNPTPPNTTVTWTIEEMPSCNVQWGNPQVTYNQWDPDTTYFPGYNAGGPIPDPSALKGVFDVNKCYRVMRIFENCCKETSSFGWTVSVSSNRMSNDGGLTWQTMSPSHVQNASGVENMELNASLNLFPNPGNGNLIIESSASLKGGQISIYNSAGKIVYSNKNIESEYKQEINITEEPAGIYLIKSIDSQGKVYNNSYVKD